MLTMIVWFLMGIVLLLCQWAWDDWQDQQEMSRIDQKWQLWKADYNRQMRHRRWLDLQKEQEKWKSN